MAEDKYAGWKYYNFQKEIADITSNLKEISRRRSVENRIGTLDQLLTAINGSTTVSHRGKEDLYRSLIGAYREVIEKL